MPKTASCTVNRFSTELRSEDITLETGRLFSKSKSSMERVTP